MSTNHQEQGTCRHLSSPFSPLEDSFDAWPGPSSAADRNGGTGDADGSGWSAKASHQCRRGSGLTIGQSGRKKNENGTKVLWLRGFWELLEGSMIFSSICGSLRDVEVIFRERPDTVFAGNVPGKAWFVRHSHGRIL